MKKVPNRKNQGGFTIIEVLIVLAIAGLIILIVFLAVPALQRNSRNTQRKNDVSAIGGALNEYINNNNGQLPTNQAQFTNSVLTNAKFSHYEASQITYARGSAGSVPSVPGDTDSVRIQGYAKCNGNNPITGTSRSVVAVFRVETGGGSGGEQCQEL